VTVTAPHAAMPPAMKALSREIDLSAFDPVFGFVSEP